MQISAEKIMKCHQYSTSGTGNVVDIKFRYTTCSFQNDILWVIIHQANEQMNIIRHLKHTLSNSIFHFELTMVCKTYTIFAVISANNA